MSEVKLSVESSSMGAFRAPSMLKGEITAFTIVEGDHQTDIWFKDGVLTVTGGCEETAKIFFEQVFQHLVVAEYQEQVSLLQDERDALRKAIIEYDDCDTAAQSKRACRAMVALAKGVK